MEIFDDFITEIAGTRYKIVRKIGQGAYGDVSLAIDRQIGRKVAIKSIKIMGSRQSQLPKAIFREIEALKQLQDGQYIVSLFGLYTEVSSICMILEYLPSDLAELISQAQSHFPKGMIKAYAQMMLTAIAYCHKKLIIHRDIKPSNILISSSGLIKLGDFGLARVFDPINPVSLSHQVATRWYRPPELLYGSRHYDFSADIWSLGVIIAELFMLIPLFPGSNDIDQMFRVFQIMGSPNTNTWPDVELLPDYNKINFPDLEPLDLRTIIVESSEDDVRFLSTLIQLNPKRRSTASEALRHAYFETHPRPFHQSDLPCPLRKKSAAAASDLSIEGVKAFINETIQFP